jgi:hypothetical protein
MGDQPVTRPLPTYRTTHTQTFMPSVGFESTTPPLEPVKTVHDLDCAVAVIGRYLVKYDDIISVYVVSCCTLYNREFNNFQPSPNINRMTK